MDKLERDMRDVLHDYKSRAIRGGSVVSVSTFSVRVSIARRIVQDFRAVGIGVELVKNVKAKHVDIVCDYWRKSGYSLKTIENRLSVLRFVLDLTGKNGLVMPFAEFKRGCIDNPPIVSEVLTSSRWEDVDLRALFGKVAVLDERIEAQMQLQYQFGLCIRDSFLLRPRIADEGDRLNLELGNCEDNRKVVPVKSSDQRQLLNYCKGYAEKRESGMVPSGVTIRAWTNRYNYTLRKVGVCKTEGLPPSGLSKLY